MKNPTPLQKEEFSKQTSDLLPFSQTRTSARLVTLVVFPCKSHWLNLPYCFSQFLEAHYYLSGSILNIVNCFPNTRVWLLVQTLFFDAIVFRFLSYSKLTHQCLGSFWNNIVLMQWTLRPRPDILEMWCWMPPLLHCWSRSSFCECSYSFKRIFNEENAMYSIRTH